MKKITQNQTGPARDFTAWLKWLMIAAVLIGLCLFIIYTTVPKKSPQDTPQPSIKVVSDTITTEAIVEKQYEQARLHLVENYIANRDIDDERVLNAMRTVPRHKFVPQDLINQAYEDHALPIGYGQTISQPYVVAWMTDLLDLKSGDKVLEIGTGSGYQAAILAEMENIDLYSIEIVPELAEQAKARLEALGYNEIHLKQGDGYYGWEEYAPFDAIIVTAAPDHLPQPLVQQLKPGGRLVIPIGPPGFYQTLWKFTLQENGELIGENMGGVGFVPFTGPGIESDTEQSPEP